MDHANIDAMICLGEALVETGKKEMLSTYEINRGINLLRKALELAQIQKMPAEIVKKIVIEIRLAAKIEFLK